LIAVTRSTYMRADGEVDDYEASFIVVHYDGWDSRSTSIFGVSCSFIYPGPTNWVL
jgi:hypothetical protein